MNGGGSVPKSEPLTVRSSYWLRPKATASVSILTLNRSMSMRCRRISASRRRPSAIETVGMECDKGTTRNGSIQHRGADIEATTAAGRNVFLQRLIAFVLAIALLLLPVMVTAPHLDAGDWHGQQTSIEAGRPVLGLSNHDATQAALRNVDAKHSGKTANGSGKATFAFVASLPEPVPGRRIHRSPHDVRVPQQGILAFSARAPPLQA